MEFHFHEDRPEESSLLQLRKDHVVEFWNAVSIADDPGSTTWEVVERLQWQVTDALVALDIELAESLTVQAMLLMTGQMQH